MDSVDIDGEVDKAMIFRQPASNLVRTKSLADVMACFGYSSDDRVEQRELVLMYRAVEKEIEAEISRTASDGRYNEAKELRYRLKIIRQEFDNLQLSAVQKVRHDQEKKFAHGKSVFLESKSEHDIRKGDAVEEECESMRADALLTHAIQRENLEHELSLIPIPRMKYSKRTNEMMNEEKELIRLCQYDEARKVRNRLDKIVPVEEARFYKDFEEGKQKKWDKLMKQQNIDMIKLEEKIKTKKWGELRRSEKDMKVAKLRMDTNYSEMKHAHLLQEKLKPEMNITPSALWAKRKNFQNTSSILRGQQLLDMVHGKRKGETVYAKSLVERHDFSRSLQDTVNLDTMNPATDY